MGRYDTSNEIDKALSYYSEDNEAEWLRFKNHFATKQKSARVDDLQRVDFFMDLKVTPSRELAELLTKKRQLEDIHWALDRIGK